MSDTSDDANCKRRSKTRAKSSSESQPHSRRSTSSTKIDEHEQRVTEQRTRLAKFESKCAALAIFLQQQQPQNVSSVEAMHNSPHYYRLEKTDEYFNYSIVSQSNLAGFSQLTKASHPTSSTDRKELFARVINLERLPGEVALRLNKSLAISKFFGDESNAFLAIQAIFCVNFQKIYVFHEQFNLKDALSHRAIDGEVTLTLLKQWTVQLASAVEYLNLHGVAHRFVRPENVLAMMSSKETLVKLTSFDMACLFWDSEQGCQLPSPKKGLLLEGIATHLLNHLPPEAFADNYDSSLVDVWSIGVLICTLLTSENPFQVTMDSEQNMTGAKLKQWKRFQPKLSIPDEVRSLLDDIFTEPDDRMTTFDLAKDQRLRLEMTTELFNREKMPRYYRVDLRKKINRSRPAKRSSIIELPKTTREISPNHFASTAPKVIDYVGFSKLDAEAEIATYQILRDESFGPEISAVTIHEDHYLKAVKTDTNLKANPNNYCLVKIVQRTTVPMRHFNQILGEACKIMGYFSNTEPHNRYMHQVLNVFFIGDNHIYIFYENLVECRSLSQVVNAELPADQLPPVQVFANDQLLSMENVRKWTRQLCHTVFSLSSHGLSHRYIRAEYVFLNGEGDVKLSHFDMACFAWNPKTKQMVPRRRALQDELDHQWDHLPPECFETTYECLLLDEWSLGVLLVFCLTKQSPFSVPLSTQSAIKQWLEWKQSAKRKLLHQYESLVALLNQIFVPADQRVNADKLLSMISPATFKLAKPKLKSPDIGRVQRTATGAEPTERKSIDGYQTRKGGSEISIKTKGNARNNAKKPSRSTSFTKTGLQDKHNKGKDGSRTKDKKKK